MGDDDTRKTWKDLRPDGDCPTIAISDSEEHARDADERAEKREQAKWQALFDSGLVNVDHVPQIREGVIWTECDDLETRVLLRAKGGSPIAAILAELNGPGADVIRALSHLAARGFIRLA